MLNLQAIVGEVTRKIVPPKVKTEETKIVHPKFADIKNQRFSLETARHVQVSYAYTRRPKVRQRYSVNEQKELDTRIIQAAQKFNVLLDGKICLDEEGMVLFETWYREDLQEMPKMLHSCRTTRDNGHTHYAELDSDGNGETDSTWMIGEDGNYEFVQEKYHYHKVSSHKVEESDGHSHRIIMPMALEHLSENIQESIGSKGDGWDALHLQIKESINEGEAYHVSIIKAGMSYNRNFYPSEVLESSVSMLNSVELKAYVDHSLRPVTSRPPSEIAGGFRQKEFVWNAQEQCIDGIFVPTLPWLKEAMRNAEAGGVSFVYQLSIDANVGFVVENHNDGKPCRRVLQFHKFNSTDIVDNASAGGRVRNSVKETAEENKDMNEKEFLASLTPERLAELIKTRPELAGAIQSTQIKETKPVPIVDPPEAVVPKAEEGGSMKPVNMERMLEQLRRTSNTVTLQEALRKSRLPQLFQDKIEEQFIEDLSEEEIRFKKRLTKVIESNTGLAAAFAQAEINKKQNGVAGTTITGWHCESQLDKITMALDGFFANEDQKLADGSTVKRYNSFREAYFELTGDKKFKGRLGESAQLRLLEAADTNTFQKILGDSITRKMQKDYASAPAFWKLLVSDVRYGNVDFRTQRSQLLGGYPALSTVAQGGTYQTITTPGDVEVTWTISKYGNLERITLEMIANDDVGIVRRLPTRLALSASTALERYILLTLIVNNPTYDADALTLFHATHSNQTTSAVSQSTLNDARASIRKQQPYGQTIVYGNLMPKYFLGPPDLEALIVSLCTQKISVIAPGDTTNTLGVNIHTNLTPLISSHLADTNNAYLIADPNVIETLVLGFLGDDDMPELFTQDMPNVGTWFDSDQLTWKMRHIYGGDVLDYRGFYRFNPA